jgi:O-methyltransferase involved in polyketide biosynthesis
MSKPNDSSRISPTAHYTSQVWFRYGMSHPALATQLGRRLHAALAPVNTAYVKLSRRPNLDMMLLARHRAIDFLLEREIAAGRVGQVLEVAAGLSPRGLTFTRHFPELEYVEADLPDMAAHKRRALDRAGTGPKHHVVEIDALADDGPASIGAVARLHLDPTRGTAIITEGLIGYFSRVEVEGMWRRFAGALRGFPHGVYFSDLNMSGDLSGMHSARVFRQLLSLFARGKVHLHYEDADQAQHALHGAGFRDVRIHKPGELPEVDFPGRERKHVVRVIEAHV